MIAHELNVTGTATVTQGTAASPGHRWVGPVPEYETVEVDAWTCNVHVLRGLVERPMVTHLCGGIVPVIRRDGSITTASSRRRIEYRPDGWYVEVPDRPSCLVRDIWQTARKVAPSASISGLLPAESAGEEEWEAAICAVWPPSL